MAFLVACLLLFALLWLVQGPCVTFGRVVIAPLPEPGPVRDLFDVGPDGVGVNRNINHIIDRILPDVGQQIKDWQMDPLYLGNLHTQDLSGCWLHGLASVFRSGNCYLTLLSSEQAVLQVEVGFERISGSCQFVKRLLFFRYNGLITMRMQNLTAFTRIGQEVSEEARPTLNYIDVDVPSDMELEAYGDGLMSFAVDALKIIYRRRMRHLVADTLRERFRETLTEHFRLVTFGEISDVLQGRANLTTLVGH